MQSCKVFTNVQKLSSHWSHIGSKSFWTFCEYFSCHQDMCTSGFRKILLVRAYEVTSVIFASHLSIFPAYLFGKCVFLSVYNGILEKQLATHWLCAQCAASQWRIHWRWFALSLTTICHNCVNTAVVLLVALSLTWAPSHGSEREIVENWQSPMKPIVARLLSLSEWDERREMAS